MRVSEEQFKRLVNDYRKKILVEDKQIKKMLNQNLTIKVLISENNNFTISK